MVGKEITPADIGKHPTLIKAAQEDIAATDVLVCGRCLTVFHFVEDFKQHRQIPCHKDSNNVRECTDTKPKIWAFLLWKATQLINKDMKTSNLNSWALYQTWVKMDERMRETWIVAGNTIQSFAKVSQSSLQETPVKITKTVVNNNTSDIAIAGRKPLTQTKPQVVNLKPPLKLPVLKPANSENDTPTASPGVNKATETPDSNSTVPRKVVIGATAKPLNRRAKRSVPNSEETIEENVEKIMAKRLNARRKIYEYLVKWEGSTNDQNTWEPVTHLKGVPQMLEIFEKQLARQKEIRAAQQAKQASLSAGSEPVVQKAVVEIKKDGVKTVTPAIKFLSNSGDGTSESSGRPSRTSKTKAMDQVKQWVSGSNEASSAESPASTASESHEADKDWSIGHTAGGGAGASGAGPGSLGKRKLEDSDYNDSNASDVNASASTLEDLEEDLIPSHTLKRMKNGSTVSVEVKARTNDTKSGIKVNGTSSRSSNTDTPPPVGPKSAEIIITDDNQASGVVRKPGVIGSNVRAPRPSAQIRILTKAEAATTSSGIVRIVPATAASATAANADSESRPQSRTTQVRVASRPTASAGSPAITVSQRQHSIQRTPTGTTIHRRSVSANTPTAARAGSMQLRTAGGSTASAASTPASGRMVIPRNTAATVSVGRPSTSGTKPVTPEQKILQLSKSGDLKVTKKLMTREDAVAQRMTPQQRQQQLRQQQQQQSQVQIQKVQQITPPVARAGSVSVRKPAAAPQPPAPPPPEEEEQEVMLCPITGKLLGSDGEPLPSPPSQTSGGQSSQESSEIDAALLLSGEQQMLTNEDGSPLLVTGEDGTIYQVAGKNAEGQTILVTQGPDGEQQFAYVAAAEGEDSQQMLTLDNAVAEAVGEQQADGEGQYLVNTTQEDGTTQVVSMTETELAQHQALAQQQATAAGDGEGETGDAATSSTNALSIQTGGEGADGQEANIPAEVVQADLPSPGGTRRVVLLLQDGTYMMTEMHDDEFKALNIAP